MDSNIKHSLLLQTLSLFASYLFTRSVELEATPVGVSQDEADEETSRFLRELAGRHSIACALKLRNVLNLIEQQVSHTSYLTRVESRGAIKGRLDLPKYIARRSKYKTLPRTYPLLVTKLTPNTPENVLTVQALRGIISQLSRVPFPKSHAEGQSSVLLQGWALSRIKRLPWAEVSRTAPIERLRREVTQRIRKRQTGNAAGYGALLDWLDEWRVDVSRLGAEGAHALVDGLLAFPVGDFFWEKVFEVWCLQELAGSLARCGCQLVDGPRHLHLRAHGPIYRFMYGAADINVWFQRQRPLGTPGWRYASGTRLAGIPDITLSSSAGSPLLVDAKFRKATTATRSEETYKMLGYAENFREVIGGRFKGLLLFVGETDIETILEGPTNGRVTLLSVSEGLQGKDAFENNIDTAVRDWLGSLVG